MPSPLSTNPIPSISSPSAPASASARLHHVVGSLTSAYLPPGVTGGLAQLAAALLPAPADELLTANQIADCLAVPATSVKGVRLHQCGDRRHIQRDPRPPPCPWPGRRHPRWSWSFTPPGVVPVWPRSGVPVSGSTVTASVAVQPRSAAMIAPSCSNRSGRSLARGRCRPTAAVPARAGAQQRPREHLPRATSRRRRTSRPNANSGCHLARKT